MNCSDEARWSTAVAAERQCIRETLLAWADMDDKIGVMRRALATVNERGTSLRLLLLLGDDLKKAVFSQLVDLVSTGHSDIGLCRAVIKSLPRTWVLQNVESAVDDVLKRFANEESFRRYAELYRELDERLLKSLVSRARKNPDPEIREIADDFAEPAKTENR